MSEKPKPFGPFGLPARVVISAAGKHHDLLMSMFGNAEMVEGRVESVWEHRRMDLHSGDADLTVLYELAHMLRDIPRDDWRVDWDKTTGI